MVLTSLHPDLVTDPWVLGLSPVGRWIWVCCLALAGPGRGYFECRSSGRLAELCGVETAEVNAFLAACAAKKVPPLITRDGRIRVMNWRRYNVNASDRPERPVREPKSRVTWDVLPLEHRSFIIAYNEVAGKIGVSRVNYKIGLSQRVFKMLGSAVSDPEWDYRRVIEAIVEHPWYNRTDPKATWDGPDFAWLLTHRVREDVPNWKKVVRRWRAWKASPLADAEVQPVAKDFDQAGRRAG